MKHTRVAASDCPYCGLHANTATDVTGTRGPKPGNYTICLKCAGLSIFKEDLSLREAEEEDLELLTEENLEKILKYQTALIQATIYK